MLSLTQSFGAVSIHVPTRGTTCNLSHTSSTLPCFNPRSHEGNDPASIAKVKDVQVSIHVPTRGTTLCMVLRDMLLWVSIHVPTRGTTDTGYYPVQVDNKFQSTFPRGERRVEITVYSTLFDVSIHVPTRGTTENLIAFRFFFHSFNPRSHEGNDLYCQHQYRYLAVSIHVPTRGTTAHYYVRGSSVLSFNPRSHEGNDVTWRKRQ